MVWTLNLYTSSSLPLWLSLAGLLLCVAGLGFFGLSARFVSMMTGKPRLNVTSKLLSWPRALEQLKYAAPNALILCGVFYGGYLYHDSKEFHDTYVLVNAVVDSQNGDYVTYHFEDDPTREPYTLNFTCSRWKPHFKPHQIIAKMTYARKGECESLDGPQYVLKLRRLNGVPILDTGE